jgi:hypothetical protein
MGPYAVVDYNGTPYFYSRVGYNTFTMGNTMRESTLTLCQSSTLSSSQGLRIWPQCTGRGGGGGDVGGYEKNVKKQFEECTMHIQPVADF